MSSADNRWSGCWNSLAQRHESLTLRTAGRRRLPNRCRNGAKDRPTTELLNVDLPDPAEIDTVHSFDVDTTDDQLFSLIVIGHGNSPFPAERSWRPSHTVDVTTAARISLAGGPPGSSAVRDAVVGIPEGGRGAGGDQHRSRGEGGGA